MDFTMIIAFWGAIVGSVGLGWSIRTELQNKGRLEVNFSVWETLTEHGEAIIDSTHVRVFVTNTGRREIWLKNIAGKSLKKNLYFSPKSLLMQTSNPIKITPGQVVTFTSKPEEFKYEGRYLFAEDTVGKKYKFPRRKYKTFMKELSKHFSKVSKA